MAADERLPLLDSEESDNLITYPRNRHTLSATYNAEGDVAFNSTNYTSVSRNGGVNPDLISPTSSQLSQAFAETDHIVSVFVVAFDTKAGIICFLYYWSYSVTHVIAIFLFPCLFQQFIDLNIFEPQIL